MRPEVILTGLDMLDEDGCWLIRNIRAAPVSGAAGPGAVVVTGRDDRCERERCLTAGFDVVLVKSAAPHLLCEVIARLARTRSLD
jgi:CheY-like chemotaxis protein